MSFNLADPKYKVLRELIALAAVLVAICVSFIIGFNMRSVTLVACFQPVAAGYGDQLIATGDLKCFDNESTNWSSSCGPGTTGTRLLGDGVKLSFELPKQ